MSKSPQDVLSQIKDEGIELIDLKFTDIHGKWQHLTLTSDMIEEDSFTEGLAFDGSSIRGWKAINASDMSMVPDASTAWIDPFYCLLYTSPSPRDDVISRMPSSA